MSRRTARGNRLGLALVGAALLLAGLAALIRAAGWWPGVFGRPDSPVISPGTQEFAAEQRWFWLLLALLLVVVGLLALRWLAVQTRTEAVNTLRLEPDPRRGTTKLSARAATAAFAADLGGDGLRRINASLRGSGQRPRLFVAAVLTDTADPATFRHRLGWALDRYRRALETDQLPTTFLLH